MGKGTLLHKFFDLIFEIILCRGDVKKQDLETQPVSYRELFRFASKHDRRCLMLGSLFACISGMIQPMVFVFGGMINSIYLKDRNQVGNPKLWEDVTIFFISLIAGGVFSLITTYLQSWLLHRGCSSMLNTLRQRYLASVLRQDSAWFGENNSGVITEQLNSNIQKIENGLSERLGMLVRGFSMYISSVVVCMFINWRLTLVAAMVGPLFAWTLGLLGKLSRKYTIQVQVASTSAAAIVEESIMNVKTVAACNAQEHMVQKYAKSLADVIPPAIKQCFCGGFFMGLSFFQCYVVLGITFWLGIYGFNVGWVERGGDVILITNALSLTGYYLGLLGPHMMAILKARIAAALIYETIDRKPETDSQSEEGVKLVNPRGDISVKNVEFSYPNRNTMVLKGVSWEANAGESIALVGKSGCGKSTSIGLLTRLYNAISGGITIDGVVIEKINIRFLRKIIGVVEQEPCLFNGTVLENITLGREGLTEEDARKAAKIANADEFIQQLQNGYETLLGVGGVSLSGGQKQRIAIARAVVTNPKILLLDEATSALDTESEKIVQNALNHAAEGRTTVIIAHRLSALKNVNRIYVMNEGVIVEEGTHEGLIQSGGRYAALAKAQEINEADQRNSEEFGISREKSIRKNSKRFSKRREDDEEVLLEELDENQRKRISSSGLCLLYCNLQGSFRTTAAALFITICRGSELPLVALQCYLSFRAVQPENKADYMHNGMITFLVCLVCGTVAWICHTGMYTFSGWTAEKVVAKLKTQALRSLLYRPCSSFDKPHSSPAACVARIAHNAPICIGGMDFHVMVNLLNATAMIVGLSIAFYFCWECGVLGLILCMFLIATLVLNLRIANASRKRKAREDMSGEYSIEIVEQARTIQLLTVEDFFMKKYSDQLLMSAQHDRRIGFIDSLNFGLSQCFVFFCDLLGYALATYLIYIGRAPVHTIFFAFSGAQIAGWSVMYSAHFYPFMVRAASSAKQLFTMIDDEDAIQSVINGGLKPDIKGEVALKSVDFSYPSRPDLLVSEQLSLAAKNGQSIALVGASGCGKSTIIALLERFYTANSGQVNIDGNNVRLLNQHHLRSNVALVSQEPVLFKGSIYENITMGAGDKISMDDVIKACKTANASTFVEALPTGYETDVGEKGRGLSGGQKQRIAIARALVRNPKIILLDEATSALDTKSEQIVQQALNDASVGRTSITIAHRLSTIQHSDRIFVIEKGAVVESGSHSLLLELNGRYAKLVEAQQLKTPKDN